MSFSIDLSKAIEGVKENRDKIIRATFFSLSGDIITSTPVGNPTVWKTKYPPKGYVGGTLRGAWNASVGSPDFTITNRKETNDNGGQTALEVESRIAGWQAGQSLYLTNPQPYARKIEFGGSKKQRPMGMVRVNIAQAQKVLDSQ